MKSFAFVILFLFLLVACSTPPVSNCPDTPSSTEIQVLLTCLETGVSTAEVEQILRRWQWINDEWGEVTGAELLPAPGEELVLSYYPGLNEGPAPWAWEEWGTLVVLARAGGQWQVAFDAATIEATAPNGEVWHDWTYHVVDIGDATGDEQDDLLFNLSHNTLHGEFAHVALLTAHGSETLYVPFLQPEAGRTTYSIAKTNKKPVLQRVLTNRANAKVITRTFTFDGGAFVQEEDVIDLALATASTTLPDGSAWFAFDDTRAIGSSDNQALPAGLYRVQNGNLTHYPMTAKVRELAVASENATGAGKSLYVLTDCSLLRYEVATWETLADDCGPARSSERKLPLAPLDVAFGPGNEIWVGGPFSLSRYNGKWTSYPINASGVLVAPGGSVWLAGWNGVAGSDCCFTHLNDGEWVTYPYSATLPVSAELQELIRALQPGREE